MVRPKVFYQTPIEIVMTIIAVLKLHTINSIK